MREHRHLLDNLNPADAKLLMCALLVGGAQGEIKTFLADPTRISESRPVEEAVRCAYHEVTRQRQETRTATFKIART